MKISRFQSMKKKLGVSVAAVALAGSLISPASLAKENNGNAYGYGKIDLVGLGDSITFGYNLGVDNNKPSSYAFPYLIGDEAKLEVSNLGFPGWTTNDLLTAIKTNKQFKQSIKHANYVTLNIGSNDLLDALKIYNGRNQNELLALLYGKTLPTLKDNLNQIISEVKKLTDAPIVLYNIYNPFQKIDPRHQLADQLLPSIINPAIQGIAVLNGTKLADAYGAFGQNQAIYVRANDIHPTIEGQKVLAEIGEEALGVD
jgi:lysophospholipase L1-like esterase